MQRIFLLLLSSLFLVVAYSQPPQLKYVEEKAQAVSLTIQVPVGSFSSTHFGGITAQYENSRRWYAIKYKMKKQFRFAYNGGISFYAGKNETVSGYDYHYPAYWLVHAQAGLCYLPAKKIDLKLTTGPGLGIYNGTTRFTWGARLEGIYFLETGIDIGIGPSIHMMKEPGADALWTVGLKSTYVF
jgi:hypothetical protein